MALSPLATTADLDDRNIRWDDLPDGNTVDIDALIESASSAIREAAGSIISATDATIDIAGTRHEWLDLPVAVLAVTSVTVNGTAVQGWKLRSGRLWRSTGWNPGHGNDWTITGQFGLAEVPSDIVDLTCALVAAGIEATIDGYAPTRGLSAVSIDDYRESYTRGDDEVISTFELPERTHRWLRERFGQTVYVTGSYR